MTAPALTGILRLATRGSALALAQARLAAAALSDRGAAGTELVVVSTGGDRNQTLPVEAMAGQGWFTTDVSRTLLEQRADIAVHSAKDLPTEPQQGIALAAVLGRGDPRDALVSRAGASLDQLQPGATVGSSSARRRALLLALRPDLVVVPMRGNVDTRLAKLDRGEVDAVVVAAAGLDRLGFGERITARLDPRVFVPAPAQGAIALEASPGSAGAAAAATVDDATTRGHVTAERAVLTALGGGCLLPLGVWARRDGERLVISAALGVEGEVRRAELGGDPERPLELAHRVAAALR